MAMLANNLSTLGVSASQWTTRSTRSRTCCSGCRRPASSASTGTFGDYDYHDKLATRLAIHYTSSTEDKQSQPGADGIENSQIRLTDGSVIFTPEPVRDGITVNRVKYRMSSLDGGLKYKGLSFEAEYYWRWLSGYEGAERLRHPRHRRSRLPDPGVGDADSETAAGLLRQLRRLRQVRQPVGSTGSARTSTR